MTVMTENYETVAITPEQAEELRHLNARVVEAQAAFGAYLGVLMHFYHISEPVRRFDVTPPQLVVEPKEQ